MSKISLVSFAAIFVILYFKNVASAEVEEKRKDEEPKYSPLWFGPRMGGRRKRNLVDESYDNIDNENMDVLLESIRKSPWTIMLFNRGRGHIVNYNLKLGKESSDGNVADITEVVERSMFAPRLGRASMFAPRLGRASMFAPRLGRAEGELDLD